MIYDTKGEVNRYYNLDDILRLNLSDSLKSEFKEKFKKLVFFDNKDSCVMGTLIGIEENLKLLEFYYIIDCNGKTMFVPVWKRLTKV